MNDQLAEVATVELTGAGVDILLPPPAPTVRPAGRARLLVAGLLVVGVLGISVVETVGLSGVQLIPALAPATRILPAGAPRPQTLARQDALVLFVPIQQSRITAILFHSVEGANVLALEPVGRPLDQGIASRLIALLSSDDSGGPSFSVDGDPTSVDVGAPVATDVYTPTDGKVLSITPMIVEGVAYGDQIAIEPLANPGVVVIASGIAADPKLSVGSPVSTRPDVWTKLGQVIDVTKVLKPVLSGYTQDGGNRLHLEVRPATAVAAT